MAAASSTERREAIVAEARRWIGTPYHHQASVKHVGCDCLGLVRGVWRALLGPEPEPVAEAIEAYEVEILDGATALRTLAAASPSVTYTSAQQTADFGAPIAWPSTLAVRAYQLSTTYGRGTPAEATLFFPLPVEV